MWDRSWADNVGAIDVFRDPRQHVSRVGVWVVAAGANKRVTILVSGWVVALDQVFNLIAAPST